MAEKQTKTSKTAHVMNLLNKGRQDQGPAAGEDRPAAQAEGQVLPLADVADADAAIAEQIKNALNEDLEPAPKPVHETPVAEAPAPAPVPEAPVAEAPAPAPQEEKHVRTEEIEHVNVMQVLVEEKAERYIRMFQLCQCPRCKVDVKALALCNLPPKYVVMGKGEMVPRITIYESRYSTAVTAQIMRACKIVMDNPRHDL